MRTKYAKVPFGNSDSEFDRRSDFSASKN